MEAEAELDLEIEREMQRNRRRTWWRRGVGLVTALALSTLFYAYWLWPILMRGKQAGTLWDLQRIEEKLKKVQIETGRYPLDLSRITTDLGMPTDRWGRPWVYLSDGEMFVLVSLGTDGRPDGTNYLGMRAEDGPVENFCPDVNADQVVSDLGWHRRCGK